MAVGAVMVVGTGSALAESSLSHGTDHPSLASSSGVAALSGVAPATATLGSGSTGTLGRTGSAAGAEESPGSTTPGHAPTSTVPSGLQVPAGGAPLSVTEDPAATTTPAPKGSGKGPIVTLPTPSASSLPNVAKLTGTVTPDAVVMLSSPLTGSQLTALRRLKGVTAIDTVDTGTVNMGGSPVVAFGVDPNSFRDFTPAASASSNQLWQYVAGGSLVSSYDMAKDRSLKLGTVEAITPGASATNSAVKGWLGAFASIGLPGVDLLVDHNYSAAFGLTPDSGLVVSAPSLDGASLQSELKSAVPDGAVELLYANQLPTNLVGNTVGALTRQKILAAALSRVGVPYVWGAVGPNSFDCSGLVQWSFRQAGIAMPRVAAEQFLTGDHIPLADAQPGDLLFWTYDPTDPTYVDHVAIYLGNGMMVVAPHTGTDVQIAPVPTNDFAGAVEVILQ
ncbi:MAG TPA: NlpC/P60 family protein [Acidimicrobiales bacterium]|nr:NlpC/P60 family protein [Acidimicrobiales bacterium]